MDSRTSEPSIPWLPRILIIDHHDSYTLNVLLLLISAIRLRQPQSSTSSTSNPTNLLERNDEISNLLSRNVLVLPHTHSYLSPEMFDKHLRSSIDAIIISPGPGSPERDQDFGTASRLLRHLSDSSSKLLPIPLFGVCLGHQGLATVFGGSVKRSSYIRHGTCSRIRWEKPANSKFKEGNVGREGAAFENVLEGTQVVRYNSLTVDEDSEYVSRDESLRSLMINFFHLPLLQLSLLAFESRLGLSTALQIQLRYQHLAPFLPSIRPQVEILPLQSHQLLRPIRSQLQVLLHLYASRVYELWNL